LKKSLARFRAGSLASLFFLLTLPLLLSGCFGEPETGPVPIKWDRDACEVCRMLISDPHFAAQVRGGKRHKAHKFDDVGELIYWLDQQSWKDDPKLEIWVMDLDTGTKWLDARKVRYMPKQHSPMDYGFGAIEDARPGSVSFEEMVKKVKQRGSTNHCLPDRNRPS
jgi:nitrous oxide reductase accessory protein NosL